MPLHEDNVREALKKVIDPELFVNIVDLGLVYKVVLRDREDGKQDVQIDMTLTSPMCPAGPQLIADSKRVLANLDEVQEVAAIVKVKEAEVAEDKKKIDAKKKEAEDKAKEYEDQISKLHEDRKQHLDKVSEDVRAHYEKVFISIVNWPNFIWLHKFNHRTTNNY